MLRLILVSISLCFACCSIASAQLFEITLPTFSQFVTKDGNFTPIGPAKEGRISRASLTRGAIYFSFTIVGGQAALDYLNRKHRLEAEVVILGEQSELISGLGISQDKWAENKDAWTFEQKRNGYFKFRTFMLTEKISGDFIELQVRDANRHIIRPVGDPPGSYRALLTIIP